MSANQIRGRLADWPREMASTTRPMTAGCKRAAAPVAMAATQATALRPGAAERTPGSGLGPLARADVDIETPHEMTKTYGAAPCRGRYRMKKECRTVWS